MANDPTVYVVDDDQAVREALTLLLTTAGLPVQTFPEARNFLDLCTEDTAGCLIVDVRMPGISGLELQETLAQRRIPLPVIVITGHGDVPMAVRAMKTGAVDFIEKPFSGHALLERVQEALRRDGEHRLQRARREAILTRIALLSPREQEIMERVVAGKYNKTIALELGISISTVEAHRSKVMEKLQAESLSDLMRMLACLKNGDGKL
ncbi:MAG: response regulator [Pseudomonadota bacterium]|nr:response regulator [Pseudomonadota bacterium]